MPPGSHKSYTIVECTNSSDKQNNSPSSTVTPAGVSINIAPEKPFDARPLQVEGANKVGSRITPLPAGTWKDRNNGQTYSQPSFTDIPDCAVRDYRLSKWWSDGLSCLSQQPKFNQRTCQPIVRGTHFTNSTTSEQLPDNTLSHQST